MKNYRWAFLVLITALGVFQLLFNFWTSHVSALAGDLIIVNDGESVLVDDFSTPLEFEDQDFRQYEFSLHTVNQTDFTPDDVPRISMEDFVSSEDRGEVEFLSEEDSAEYDFGASNWIRGPQALTNLADQAVNELDFEMSIPYNLRSGSYTAAVVFRNAANDRLGHYLIVINVDRRGPVLPEPEEMELLKEKSQINLQSGEAEIVLVNHSQWHVDALVQIVFELEDEDGNKEYKELYLEQEVENIGILPDSRQVFSVPSDPDFLTRLTADEILKIELTVFDRSSAYELKTADVMDLISEAGETVDEDENENENEKMRKKMRMRKKMSRRPLSRLRLMILVRAVSIREMSF